MPRGLFARAFLILIIPTILVQATSIYVFYERHWESVSRNMAETLAGEISTIVTLIEDASPKEREKILRAASNFMKIDIEFISREKIPAEQISDGNYNFLLRTIRNNLDNQVVVTDARQAGYIVVNVATKKGVLRFITTSKKLENPTTYIFISWLIGSAVIFFFISLIFLRNQIRPITSLSEAAEKFGKGFDMPYIKPSGAIEVRKATAAFITMSKRIKRQVNQRFEMLAGISHDLRTPLTRMKLELAMLDKSEAVKGLEDDVSEMQRMVDGYINFVKGEGKEQPITTNLNNFLAEIVQKYDRMGKNIDFAPNSLVADCEIRQNAVSRAITNIIDNAIRYADKVSVALEKTENSVAIIVDDNGLGIPDNEKNKIFRAFYRVDKSRNSQTGGVGLGLTIARDIAITHGGDIEVSDSPIGGARFIFRIAII